MEKRMQWCCNGFRAQFENAGGRGFSVFGARSAGLDLFILQHRATEPGDPGPPDHGQPLSVVTDVAISCCPWCGTELRSFYRDTTESLRRQDLLIPLS